VLAWPHATIDKIQDSQEDLVTPGDTPDRSVHQSVLKAISSPNAPKVIFFIMHWMFNLIVSVKVILVVCISML
jgi:hypothetical protein